jgi:hypothetical protein
MCIGLMMVGRLTHTAESAVSEPRASEGELAIEKLKRYKLPSTVEIPSELD